MRKKTDRLTEAEYGDALASFEVRIEACRRAFDTAALRGIEADLERARDRGRMTVRQLDGLRLRMLDAERRAASAEEEARRGRKIISVIFV